MCWWFLEGANVITFSPKQRRVDELYGPGAGIPSAPLPRCRWGRDAPHKPGCARVLTHLPKTPWEQMSPGSGRALGRHSEAGKGNGNSKCNLISVAVINQHRDQVLRLP